MVASGYIFAVFPFLEIGNEREIQRQENRLAQLAGQNLELHPENLFMKLSRRHEHRKILHHLQCFNFNSLSISHQTALFCIGHNKHWNYGPKTLRTLLPVAVKVQHERHFWQNTIQYKLWHLPCHIIFDCPIANSIGIIHLYWVGNFTSQSHISD